MKDYLKQTITWETMGNDGFGDGFSNPQLVDDCYIEKSTMLKRGEDDTTHSNAMFIIFKDVDFKKGDRITYPDESKFVITDIEVFYKPRSTTFRHKEVIMK